MIRTLAEPNALHAEPAVTAKSAFPFVPRQQLAVLKMKRRYLNTVSMLIGVLVAVFALLFVLAVCGI